MKKTFFVLIIVSLMVALLPSVALAKAPTETTISIRNTTGEEVQFNYRTADGNLHWVTIPAGQSYLTLPQGVASYWADPSCGHISGVLNFNDKNKTLWVACSPTKPIVTFSPSRNASLCADTGFYESTLGGNIYFYTFTNWVDITATWQEALDEATLRSPDGISMGCFNPSAPFDEYRDVFPY